MPVRAFIYVVIAATLCSPVQAEEIRDFYSEPGLNPFKESIHQENNEHIDPFSGTLQHKHVDLFIPGNGGMDIKITRVYTSLQERLGAECVNNFETPVAGSLVSNAALPRVRAAWVLEG